MCKEDSHIKDIFEELIEYLSIEVTFSNFNIAKSARKFAKDRFKDCHHRNTTIKIPELGQPEKNFYQNLLYVFDDENSEMFQWSTESIGTWVVQNFNYMKFYCPDMKSNLTELKINDLFTEKGEKVSLLDVAHLFSIMDYEALLPNYEKVCSFSFESQNRSI